MRYDPLFGALNAEVWLTFEKTLVLVGLLYLFSRARFFSSLLFARSRGRERFYAFLFFTALAVMEDLLLPATFSPFNPRIIVACVAGLMAGPLMGLGVGLVSGVVYLLLEGGGIAHMGLAAGMGGLLCGLIAIHCPRPQEKLWAGLVVAVLVSLLKLRLIAFQEASLITWKSLLLTALPLMLINAAAVCALLLIVEDIKQRREMIARAEVSRALQVVNESLTSMRQGLDPASAALVADIVMRLSGVDAVALTDRESVLAHRGLGSGHHRCGDAVSPNPVLSPVLGGANGGARGGRQDAPEAEPVRVAHHAESSGCHLTGCPLASAVIAPLSNEDGLLGTVVLYQTEGKAFTADTIELAVGFAKFLSTYLLQRRELEQQTRLAASAELKALQAQMRPHFLFNTLSTAAGLIRPNPDAARQVLIHLSHFLRATFRQSNDVLITLREELETVRTYLAIQQVRFESRLRVVEEIEPAAMRCAIPPLVLQTLVENAIVHGIAPKVGGGTLWLVARRRGRRVWFWVMDDGVGMSQEARLGALRSNSALHGLPIVQARLRRLYGEEFRLRLRGRKGRGTVVGLCLPGEDQEGWEAEGLGRYSLPRPPAPLPL